MKIAIIGAGNMGGAIALGLVKSGAVEPADIVCADKSAAVRERLLASEPLLNVSDDNVAAVQGCNVVIIAVKPWLVKTVVEEIREALDYDTQTIVSVAAGVEFSNLSAWFYIDAVTEKTPQLFRLIPNIAIEMLQSMNFLAAYDNATDEQTEELLELFSHTGLTLPVSEKQLRSGTALASCGIAYALRYIRACVEGGVQLGFYPDDAQKIVLQTIKGAVALLNEHNSHPETEIDKVTTPGGLTIKGLNAMEEHGFTNAVIKGILRGEA
jgi:pyrroline-5-carboxylate reductase